MKPREDCFTSRYQIRHSDFIRLINDSDRQQLSHNICWRHNAMKSQMMRLDEDTFATANTGTAHSEKDN